MWNYLKPGGKIAVIAPATREPSIERFLSAKQYFLDSGYTLEFFGNQTESLHPFHADADEARADALIAALDSDSEAVLTLRGGYGCAKVVEILKARNYVPKVEKPLIGFSDITALLIYFHQTFGWRTIHGAGMVHIAGDGNNYSPDNLQLMISLLCGELHSIIIDDLKSIGSSHPIIIEGEMVGGCLSLIQNTIGTNYQLNGKDKIIFLEDAFERGYRIDRMLYHLLHAGVFSGAKAIIYGDMVKSEESNGVSLLPFALEEFAASCGVPFFQSSQFGHGRINKPITLGGHGKIFDGKLEVSY